MLESSLRGYKCDVKHPVFKSVDNTFPFTSGKRSRRWKMIDILSTFSCRNMETKLDGGIHKLSSTSAASGIIFNPPSEDDTFWLSEINKRSVIYKYKQNIFALMPLHALLFTLQIWRKKSPSQSVSGCCIVMQDFDHMIRCDMYFLYVFMEIHILTTRPPAAPPREDEADAQKQKKTNQKNLHDRNFSRE